ncbi:d09b1ff1-84b0-4840-92d2-d11c3b83c9f6, partial [Thermothielavioides terrestris]
ITLHFLCLPTHSADSMGRPRIDLEPYKDFILQQYQAGLTCAQILSNLYSEHGVQVGTTTFYSCLKRWGVATRQQRTRDSDALRETIEERTIVDLNQGGMKMEALDGMRLGEEVKQISLFFQERWISPNFLNDPSHSRIATPLGRAPRTSGLSHGGTSFAKVVWVSGEISLEGFAAKTVGMATAYPIALLCSTSTCLSSGLKSPTSSITGTTTPFASRRTGGMFTLEPLGRCSPVHSQG